ncbi:hypothetical protein [Nocardioides yefusunii]|uniref:Oligosaccharide flippase family protein n=1 Tax=Nocardioides yefusunii TaxID=2500546 RepID=A0ABW1QV06_9ACTN|nr:hypothetical protein [Nocardioides yefusunii]
MTGILSGALLAHLTGDAKTHAGANLVATLTAMALVQNDVLRSTRSRSHTLTRAELRWAMTAQAPGLTAGLLAAFNSCLPILVVARWFPTGLPTFALGERLYRMALSLSLPVAQSLHGHVPSASGALTLRRMATALVPLTMVATAIGAGFATALPAASRIYTRGDIIMEWPTAVCFGIALSCLVVTSSLGVAGLDASGHSVGLVRASVCGLVVCLVTCAAAAVWAPSAGGVAGAVCAAEACVLAVQIRELSRVQKLIPTGDATSPRPS